MNYFRHFYSDTFCFGAVLVVVILLLSLLGCSTSKSTSLPKTTFIKHKEELDVLRKYLAEISKGSTFPTIVEPLKKSMHNPDRFAFIRAESSLHERRIRSPDLTRIRYYYLIRIHFRGENAYGAIRAFHQDYHLHPNGKIIPIKEK